jgi:hypothetical protein
MVEVSGPVKAVAAIFVAFLMAVSFMVWISEHSKSRLIAECLQRHSVAECNTLRF